MNFNQKLIQLRKNAGLSQEELGYKLNVTRQTISKWELGLTSPEMDKLKELSQIFNITVDELIGKNEVTTQNTTTEYSPVYTKSNNKNTLKTILIILGVILIIYVALRLIFGALALSTVENIFNNFKEESKQIKEDTAEIIENAKNGSPILNEIQEDFEKNKEEIDKEKEEYNKLKEEALNTFNQDLEKDNETFTQETDKMKKEFEEFQEKAREEFENF